LSIAEFQFFSVAVKTKRCEKVKNCRTHANHGLTLKSLVEEGVYPSKN
jgi:hypothetical protein